MTKDEFWALCEPGECRTIYCRGDNDLGEEFETGIIHMYDGSTTFILLDEYGLGLTTSYSAVVAVV